MKEKTKRTNEFKPRAMTILRGRMRKYVPLSWVPSLHLTGEWMGEAGFKPGDKIQIKVKRNTLIICRKGSKKKYDINGNISL